MWFEKTIVKREEKQMTTIITALLKIKSRCTSLLSFLSAPWPSRSCLLQPPKNIEKGALEQAEEEERRLSRSGAAPAAAGAAGSSLLQSSTARQRSWPNGSTCADGGAADKVHKEKHGNGDLVGAAFSKSGRSRTRSRSGGEGGGDNGGGDDRVSVGDGEGEGADIESERLDRNTAAAAAYRRALARVRHDTVQEGLRQDQARQNAGVSGGGGTGGGPGRYPQERWEGYFVKGGYRLLLGFPLLIGPGPRACPAAGNVLNRGRCRKGRVSRKVDFSRRVW